MPHADSAFPSRRGVQPGMTLSLCRQAILISAQFGYFALLPRLPRAARRHEASLMLSRRPEACASDASDIEVLGR